MIVFNYCVHHIKSFIFILFFSKKGMSKSETRTGKPHPKSKFTPEEDLKLKRIIFQFGDSDWNLISRLMNNRNQRQCRERWQKYLSPFVRFDPWTPEEDKLLNKLVNDFGQKWVKISQFFKNRTDINVKNRWMVLKRMSAKQPTASPPAPTTTVTSPLTNSMTSSPVLPHEQLAQTAKPASENAKSELPLPILSLKPESDENSLMVSSIDEFDDDMFNRRKMIHMFDNDYISLIDDPLPPLALDLEMPLDKFPWD